VIEALLKQTQALRTPVVRSPEGRGIPLQRHATFTGGACGKTCHTPLLAAAVHARIDSKQLRSASRPLSLATRTSEVREEEPSENTFNLSVGYCTGGASEDQAAAIARSARPGVCAACTGEVVAGRGGGAGGAVPTTEALGTRRSQMMELCKPAKAIGASL